METKRRVLVFGDTQLLRRLAAALHASPLLMVVERSSCDVRMAPDEFDPDVILVDGAQITPEQFHQLIDPAPSSHSTLISVDPLTYQLTILSSPHSASPLADVARIIEFLSLSLAQPG